MTSVKHFHSAMTGAPVLSGAAGTLIPILDACLVDGFNLKTVDSLVVSGGVATANISLGVGAFDVDTIVLIAGAAPSGLNGEKRVLSVTSNTLTFDATGISDQTATGTISAKLAPAGWSKVYAGTNLAVYRSTDVTGTRHYLRVDDTNASNARVIGYESMSDINTGTGPFPTTAQLSGGGYWPKASTTTPANARGWTVIANSKTFYIHTNTHATVASAGLGGIVHGFGDVLSLKSGDAYAAFLNCSSADVTSSTSSQTNCLGYGNGSTGTNSIYVPRSYTAAGTAVNVSNVVESFQSSGGQSGAVNQLCVYPNGPDNGLVLSRKLVVEPTGPHIRGVLPGALHVSQNAHANFTWRDKVAAQGQYVGRKLLAVKGGFPASTASSAVMFFDITGPWG